MCPENSVNWIRAGAPVIRSFEVDGRETAAVQPGDTVKLTWNLRNVDSFKLTRVSGVGPQFAGLTSVANPPGNQYVLGQYHGSRPRMQSMSLRLRALAAQREHQ